MTERIGREPAVAVPPQARDRLALTERLDLAVLSVTGLAAANSPAGWRCFPVNPQTSLLIGPDRGLPAILPELEAKGARPTDVSHGFCILQVRDPDGIITAHSAADPQRLADAPAGMRTMVGHHACTLLPGDGPDTLLIAVTRSQAQSLADFLAEVLRRV